ncbi:MAG: DUF421 domain-containing protein [Pirellulaceae bacterium]|nr:DUF421 domain-containing protein [Pirellulaceae bacterium]
MKDVWKELQRIFLGDASPFFMLEIAFRTLFIFVYTLLLLRWMGKRGMGQLSPFEFAIIIALGSVVGDPMISGEIPLFHSMLVISIVVGLQRFLGRLTQNNDTMEVFVESQSELLVASGRIDTHRLELERLSKNELFEMMRLEGISHLGQVRQAFLEPSGRLSVIRWEPSRPGLSILPPGMDSRNLEENIDDRWWCCSQCGATMKVAFESSFYCPYCKTVEHQIACVGLQCIAQAEDRTEHEGV